jgi:hypothetical protein
MARFYPSLRPRRPPHPIDTFEYGERQSRTFHDGKESLEKELKDALASCGGKKGGKLIDGQLFTTLKNVARHLTNVDSYGRINHFLFFFTFSCS